MERLHVPELSEAETTGYNEREWRDIFYSSHDGLKLYARHYLANGRSLGEVVCLPGLTRNSKDFHRLAVVLCSAEAGPFDVYCLDFRGRGRSAHDPDWSNYTPLIELLDTLDFITLQGIHKSAFIGTSRGGIVTMLLAAARPNSISCAVFNDIGPVIDTRGLVRIAGYVGLTPVPANWSEAVSIVRQMNQSFFPELDDDDWLELAHQVFDERGGGPAAGYDANLAKAFSGADEARSGRTMWPQFKALSRVPCLVIRGETSDILSEDTVAKMLHRHPMITAVTVKDEGHAPLLRDHQTIQAIVAFLHSAADAA